jgi:hypothetical protein
MPEGSVFETAFGRRCNVAISHCGLSPDRSSSSVAITILSAAIILLAATSAAQQQPQPTLKPGSQSLTSSTSQTITVPAATRLALVLTNPVDSKSTHHGDQIDTQTTAPVTVGNQVVIPAGTFVQGKVDKLTRNRSRGEFLMQSISLVFPNGYVANVAGPINIQSDEGTAWPYPTGRTVAGAIAAPLAGAGIGALIGSAAHTTQTSMLGSTTITTGTAKGIAIGSVVGLAAGSVVSLVLLTRSHRFYIEVGSPMETTLPQPLTLAANQVADAVQQAQSPPVPAPRMARHPPPPLPTDHGTCYTPGTPGTPPSVIPGTPATGGMPGTPDIVNPGTPAIPGTPYPCP